MGATCSNVMIEVSCSELATVFKGESTALTRVLIIGRMKQ